MPIFGRRGDSGSAAASTPSTASKEIVKREIIVDNAVFHVNPRYASGSLLGQGSYGVVISAVDKENGKKRVAIKQISHPFDSVAEARHVLREMRMLRLLKHPNILPLVAVDDPTSYTDFRDVYLVTPLSDGDLTSLLEKRKWSLTDEEIRLLICQVLRALKFIHSGNVVHRDLKPGNILVDKNMHVQLCDLGLARYIDPEEEAGLTKNVTTKHYRAPEVMLCGDEYTHAIDLWAVGCILFELLARRKIFEGLKFKSQVEAIFTIIGTPTEADTAFMHNDWGKWFIKRLPKHRPPSLKEQLPKDANQDAVDLVSKLMVFDPHMRISATDALKHPFLAPMHDEEKEPILESSIPIEEYEPPTTNRDGSKMSKDDMKYLIWQEVARFNPGLEDRFNRRGRRHHH